MGVLAAGVVTDTYTYTRQMKPARTNVAPVGTLVCKPDRVGYQGTPGLLTFPAFVLSREVKHGFSAPSTGLKKG